ncbi:hypothetical protein V1477_013669, partial [Vespula maculifrons]
ASILESFSCFFQIESANDDDDDDDDDDDNDDDKLQTTTHHSPFSSVLRPAYELSVRLTAMNLVDAIDVALTGIGGEVTGVSRAKILSLRYGERPLQEEGIVYSDYMGSGPGNKPSHGGHGYKAGAIPGGRGESRLRATGAKRIQKAKGSGRGATGIREQKAHDCASIREGDISGCLISYARWAQQSREKQPSFLVSSRLVSSRPVSSRLVSSSSSSSSSSTSSLTSSRSYSATTRSSPAAAVATRAATWMYPPVISRPADWKAIMDPGGTLWTTGGPNLIFKWCLVRQRLSALPFALFPERKRNKNLGSCRERKKYRFLGYAQVAQGERRVTAEGRVIGAGDRIVRVALANYRPARSRIN